MKTRFCAVVIWTALAVLIAVPLAFAAASPYLGSRNIAYIIGGFAGIICLGVLLVQPLLAAGFLPGLHPMLARRWHQRIGVLLLVCTAVHVGGLYLTSPPDVLDALLLASPTSFSIFGVIA
jgi:predicted ferric reductase